MSTTDAIAAMVEGISNLHVHQPTHTLMPGAHATTAEAAGAKVAELTPAQKWQQSDEQ